MKNILKALIFVAGAVSGAAAMWYLTSKRHEEEIDSVKRAYEEKYRSENDLQDEASEIIEKQQYAGDKSSHYVISPAEFGQFEDYEQIDLIYYRDRVLADDKNNEMSEEEIENTVGKESLRHFGEYEEDSVYVRNDRLRCDFAIILDQRTFSESAPLYKEGKC